MITMLAMPKETPETDTVPITIRMDRQKRERLLAFGKKYPFKLTLTQLIDAAVDEYLEKHEGAVELPPKRPPKK